MSLLTKNFKKYLVQVMPILISAFTIVALTMISNNKWLTAGVQIPIWLALIWWFYAKENFFDDDAIEKMEDDTGTEKPEHPHKINSLDEI